MSVIRLGGRDYTVSQIETERLQLRFPLTDVDPRHVAWLNDKNLMRWSEQRYQEHDCDTQRRFLLQALVDGNPLCFDIILQDTTKPVGPLPDPEYGCSIGTIHAYLDRRHRRADLGIMLGPGYHGKGYAEEAWTAVMDHLAKEHGPAAFKFEAGCASGNKPMIRLLERMGFFPEGRRYNHFIIDGRHHDLVQYGKMC